MERIKKIIMHPVYVILFFFLYAIFMVTMVLGGDAVDAGITVKDRYEEIGNSMLETADGQFTFALSALLIYVGVYTGAILFHMVGQTFYAVMDGLYYVHILVGLWGVITLINWIYRKTRNYLGYIKNIMVG